jgi:MoaA/NifB/PqqE/SkfB family radical SAM enzyme
MQITGLHLLLTYECNLECDHCFTWGSPWNRGTMTLKDIRTILKQAEELGTVRKISYEGGEPFLYYPVLVQGVVEASKRGFEVELVTNAYWATAAEDSLLWLNPFSGKVKSLSVSTDAYHWDDLISHQAKKACAAAEELGIANGLITIRGREEPGCQEAMGQLLYGEYQVMHRGRAAENLVEGLPGSSWVDFKECPYEDLRDPRRVHIDPLGYVHVCQGISLGNVFRQSLSEICEGYKPETHPIAGPLLRGGPAELVREYRLHHEEEYVDACHLCYKARIALRDRYPEILVPDHMYGVIDAD